jgi:hypothetical protein
MLLNSILSSPITADEAWKLEKDKNGIKVWNRKVAGSALKEFKVSTILNVTPEKLVAFLKNTGNYEKWMYKVDEGSVKVLKRVNDNDYYTYMTLSAPFIKSRETITHMVFNPHDSKGVITITLDGAPDLLPLNEKYVRIPKMKAYFKIIPLGNGKVELIHQAWGAPGGNVPDALANLSSVDCPFYMFTKIKELL